MDTDKLKAFEELPAEKKLQFINLFEIMTQKEKFDELLDFKKQSPDKSSKQKTLDSWLIKSKNRSPLKTNVVTPVPTPDFEPNSSSERVKHPSTFSSSELQNSEIISGSENVIPGEDKLSNKLGTCIYQNFDPVVVLEKLSSPDIDEDYNSIETQMKNITSNIQQDILLPNKKESNHAENLLPIKCSRNVKHYNKKEPNICEEISLNSDSGEVVENGPVKRALRSNSQLSKNESIVEKEKHSARKCLSKSIESIVPSLQKQLRSRNKQKKDLSSANAINNTLVSSSEDLLEDLKNSPSQSSSSILNDVKIIPCVLPSRQTKKNITVKKLQSVKDLNSKKNESSEDLDHQSISASNSEIVEKKFDESAVDLTKHSPQKKLRSKNKQTKNLSSVTLIKNTLVSSSENLVKDLKNSHFQNSGSNTITNNIENAPCVPTSRKTKKHTTVKKLESVKDLDSKKNENSEDLENQSISVNDSEIVGKKSDESVADLTKHSPQKQSCFKNKQKKHFPTANSIKNTLVSFSEDLVKDLKNSSKNSGFNTNNIENVPCIPPSRKTKKNIIEKKLQSVKDLNQKKNESSEDFDHQSISINHLDIVGKKIDESDADLTKVNSDLCSKSKRQVKKRSQRQKKVQLENLNFERDITKNNKLVDNLEKEICNIENDDVQSLAKVNENAVQIHEQNEAENIHNYDLDKKLKTVSNTSREQVLETISQHTDSLMSSDTSNLQISKLSSEQLIENTTVNLNSQTTDDSKLDFLDDKDRTNKLDLNFKIQVVSSKNISISTKDSSKNLRKRVIPELISDQNTLLTDFNITYSKTDVSGTNQNTLNCSAPKKKCKKKKLPQNDNAVKTKDTETDEIRYENKKKRKTSEKNSESSQLIHNETWDESNLSDNEIISIAKPLSTCHSEEFFSLKEDTSNKSATSTKSLVTSLAPKSTSNLKVSSRPRRKKNFVSDEDQLENINSAASELESDLIAPKIDLSPVKINLFEKSDNLKLIVKNSNVPNTDLINEINKSSNKELSISNQNFHDSNQELNSDPNTLQTDSSISSSQTDKSETSENMLHCSVPKKTGQKAKSSQNDNVVQIKDVEIDVIRYDDKKKKKTLSKNSGKNFESFQLGHGETCDDDEINLSNKTIVSIIKPSSTCQSEEFSPIEQNATINNLVTSLPSKSTSSLKLCSKPKQKKIFITDKDQSENLKLAASELKSNLIDSDSESYSSSIKTNLLEKSNNSNCIAENISVSNANIINEINYSLNQEMSANSSQNIIGSRQELNSDCNTLQTDSNVLPPKTGESEINSYCSVPKKTVRKKKTSQNDKSVETKDTEIDEIRYDDKKKRITLEKNFDRNLKLPQLSCNETCDEINLLNKNIISTEKLSKTYQSEEIIFPIEDTMNNISATTDNLVTPEASNLKLGSRPKREKYSATYELKSNLIASESNSSPIKTNLLEKSAKSNDIAKNIDVPINDSPNPEMTNNSNYDLLPPEFEAYNKLSKICSSHGLKLNEIFETKEFQEMMKEHGNNQDAIVFIGTHKCSTTNKISPLLSLHKSKKMLMETLSSLQGKNLTND